jgi:NADPH:quinone reductase-like Zn-dependent oxidoreductase
MKAVHIHNYGGRDVLHYDDDAQRPVPGPGEVLIQVHATSVNPFDCWVHNGRMANMFNYTVPLIPGSDASGVIEELGEGVTDVAVGDEVYTRAGVFRNGSHAEYVVAFAADVAPKPECLDHVQAAALPHVTLTAYQALFELADLQPGQTILIHAAAGGVGHVAVQLAKWRGAQVIGTASINLPTLKMLGVDEAVDYSTTNFEDVAKNVDVVLDLMGGETEQRSWKTLKPGGILLSTVQVPAPDMAAAHGVRARMVDTNPPIRKTLNEMGELVNSGKVMPIVSEVMPLSEIQRAHELLEARHNHGKIVLQVVQ